MILTPALLVWLIAGAGGLQAQSQPMDASATKTLNLSAYAELLRSDVRAQKVAILTELMELTPAEDAQFWPLYRQYDLEMSKLGDERVALIEEYVSNYSTLNDATAQKLALKAIDLEARRNTVKAEHYARMQKALSPRTALRFLQVEQQLLLIIDLQISSSLPIARK